jgi:recombination protein RecA
VISEQNGGANGNGGNGGGAARPERDEKARRQALEFATSTIRKKHGPGAIMRLGSDWRPQVEAISTGCLSLDLALGVGGLPRGRLVEIYGPESSGKTTLALHVIANVQKNRGVAAFIDAEHALDPLYAKRLGVNLEQLLISQPDCGEQALEIAETLAASSAVDVIVIDSVAALVPKAELEGEMGDAHVGLQARLMSQALRKLTGVVSRANCLVIFINQLREKIGVMFGNPETTTGGKALKFYASVRLDIRKTSSIKQGEDTIGSRVKAKVVKNKLAPPFKVAEFDILFDRGISWTGDVLDLACEQGIVQKSGAWFSHGEQRLGQGRENTVQYLQENPAALAEIESELIAKLFPAEGPRGAPAAGTLPEARADPAPSNGGGGKRERGERK